MSRWGVLVAATVLCTAAWSGVAQAAPKAPAYEAGKGVKVNVMGEWAHPDDDTSFIGPCGVWHQRYGVRCGIIMVTRGEGGGNAVGTEQGPALGLRRENEDRVAHYRSGTVDVFNLDKVDFFYNQSAPLTQTVWNERDTLRRIVRIIRMTQPDVYVGFTPTLDAGHGNHQQAGRFIWEGFQQAADPTKFPEQLQANGGTLSTWQVKKVLSGGSTAGTGGTNGAADCTTGFTPDATNLDAVVGTWLGYDSPYRWPTGNLQDEPAGTPKSWAQVAREGTAAYPTQSRVMFQGDANPSCSRFGQTAATVPFEPNLGSAAADGATPNPLAGRDDAVLFGAVKRAPGGLPLGTGMTLTDDAFYHAPGSTFPVQLKVSAGRTPLPAGTVALTPPTGLTATGGGAFAALGAGESRTVTVQVTADAAATTGNKRIAARVTSGTGANQVAGYTDTVVRIVPAAEGRLQRFGKFAEYDDWTETKGRPARRLGRSAANETIAVGTTKTLTVRVRNWSASPQTGTVSLTKDAGATNPGTFAAVADRPYTAPAGATVPVTLQLESTDTALPASQTAAFTLTTTSGTGPTAATSSEPVTISLLPRTTIPKVAAAPTLDGTRDAAYGPSLDVSRLWQGTACAPGDCGGAGTNAAVAVTDDAMYVHVDVVDDDQAYAVKPAECAAHWQSDSVEILIDPRGDASRRAGVPDTANTFKLGVFPYTDDPTGANGNGVNGPCWERDADNHQGFATGPLSLGNAPGVEVSSTATWVGSNSTTVDHAYAGGGYSLEVKIPLADLPADLNPTDFGLNVTPYDNDDTSAPGTTALRRIDQSTRLGYSAFGSVQSDPYRWGRASIAGGGPAGSDDVDPVDTSSPNLEGAKSPQTIWSSAHNGVPISGRAPSADVTIGATRLDGDAVTMDVTSTGSGTLRAFVWSGLEGAIPVYTTSCSPAEDPEPDYGLTPCALSDGQIPPWGGDQSGRVQAAQEVAVTPGTQTITIPVTPEQRAKLRANGSALVSYVSSDDRVQAFDLPLASAGVTVSASGAGSEDGPGSLLQARVTGTQPFPGDPTGTVRFAVDGTPVGDAVALDDRGRAELRVPGDVAGRTVTAAYSGDGDYVASEAAVRVASSGAGPAGPQGPAGPAGPRGPRGRDARVVTVSCRVVKRRKRVDCVVRELKATKRSARLRATLRLAGQRRTATRTARGKVTVRLNARKRLGRTAKVTVTVTSAGETARLRVRAGAKTRTAVGKLQPTG